MRLATWLDGAARRLSSVSHRPVALLTPDELQHAAMCERMRVDRNGSVLSVLTIELPTRKNSAKDRGAFALALRERLRVTDTAGILHDGRFAALLPDTSESGAWKVAADLCEPFVPGNDRPRCEVFEYPDQSGGDGAVAEDSDPKVPIGAPAPGEAFFALRPSLSKRMVDVLGASMGLIAASPILLAAIVAVKCTSRGGAFFLQEREGLGGKRFLMVKLRTMRTGADRCQDELRGLSEQDGPAFKLTNDPRVTRVGKLLRKTSIDELPQLWNVLRGEMSLVGPRPLPTAESQQCSTWQRQRLLVVPGLTCTWQIRGRNIVPFEEWIRMDLSYIRRRSVWYDLWLIAQTPPSIALSKGPR